LLAVIERGAVRFESGDVAGSERDFEQAKRMSPYGMHDRESLLVPTGSATRD